MSENVAGDELPDMCCVTPHKSVVLIIYTTKIYQTQTSHTCTNSNLLAHASHHRRWLEKIPLTLEPASKLQASSMFLCNILKLSDEVTESGDPRYTSVGNPHFDNVT